MVLGWLAASSTYNTFLCAEIPQECLDDPTAKFPTFREQTNGIILPKYVGLRFVGAPVVRVRFLCSEEGNVSIG
jgi:hypothetical protein